MSKTLLVMAPASYGDCFERARHLPELTKRGIDWKILVPPDLETIFDRTFPGHVVNSAYESDYRIDMMDGLAAALKNTVRPNPIKFVALSDKVNKYNNLLKPSVGLCFHSASRLGDTWRSFKEQEAQKIISSVDNVNWVCLQYQFDKYYKPEHPFRWQTPVFNNWEDTLGLIENLDAIVTIDSAIAHLSISMGKPTIVLLGTAPSSVVKYTMFEEMYPNTSLKVFYPIYGGSQACHSYQKFIEWANKEFLRFIAA
jgi:hypothetical protein